MYSKVTREKCAAGDTLEIKLPSGGGYGIPFEREAAQVLDDVLDDYLSIEDSREHYGVVLTGSGTALAVDEAGTARLRAAV